MKCDSFEVEEPVYLVCRRCQKQYVPKKRNIHFCSKECKLSVADYAKSEVLYLQKMRSVYGMGRFYAFHFKGITLEAATTLAMDSLWQACLEWFLPEIQTGNFKAFWRAIMKGRVRAHIIHQLRYKRRKTGIHCQLNEELDQIDTSLYGENPKTEWRIKIQQYEKTHEAKRKREGRCIKCGIGCAPYRLCRKHRALAHEAQKRYRDKFYKSLGVVKWKDSIATF